MNEFGNFIKKLRGKMTYREAAEKSGISHAYIRYLEIGKRPGTNTPINPSPEMLRGLATAYNHPYKDLMIRAGYDYEESDSDESFLDDPQKLRLFELMKELDAEDTTHVTDYVEYWIQKKKQNQ